MISKLSAYAELLRISNVLTAAADVWMGMVVATGALSPPAVSVPLTVTSILLYLSGMVLNDVFDARQDAVDRPTRPIPSGRISRTEAAALGGLLMLGGLGLAAWVGAQNSAGEPFFVACLLAVAILLYDRWLKHGPMGPVAMGMCRGLNAALGMTAFEMHNSVANDAAAAPSELPFILFGLTVYIAGVTLFARQEATISNRGALGFAALVSFAGLALLAATPFLAEDARQLTISNFRWLVLWVVIALLVGRRYVAAILQPRPRQVQAAVGNAIQSIIVIDAGLAWGYAEPFWALAIFALLPPTLLMARLIPPT